MNKKSSKDNVIKKWKRDGSESKYKTTIAYSPSICPDVMRVRLPYVRLGNFTGIGIVEEVFRGNGMFDPEVAVGGNQPLGFDEWSNLYRRYRVLASKLTIRVSSGDSVDATMMFVVPLNSSGSIGNRQELLENEKAKKQILGIQTSQNRGVLSYYMPSNKIRGVSESAVKNEIDYSALTTADPQLQWYWHAGIVDVSSSGDTISSDVYIEIEYYVEFFDRATLTRS